MIRLPRYWPTVALFVAITALQASVAVVSIQLLSTVRAYVTGESLYSKGQKDAQIYLLDYAEQHRESDYVKFMAALAFPLGDRAARVALQRPVPDVAAARQGFLDGGNHPDDIDNLVLMFRLFQHVPFMSRPIATWTEGDRMIQETISIVERARERILAGDVESPAVEEMRQQAPLLNARLTELTSAFSFQLGEASRTTQHMLLGVNTFIAVLLLISGLAFVRRSARQQAAAELRLQRLIHAVTDAVVTVDAQRRIVLFNRAAETLFGLRAQAALGTRVDALVRQAHAPDESAANDVELSLAPTAGELRALVGRRRDGSDFPVEASLSRVDNEGEVLTTVVLRDVTARIQADAERRANEALEASNKAKTEFLSRMSHELRTPLNAVIGFSRLLRMDSAKPLSVQQMERIEHVENAGAHLLALVNDVLDLSRIESGEMSIAAEAVLLTRTVEEAATMVSPLVTEASIEVFLAADATDTGSGSSNDLWVMADPVRLRQVLVNLLSNAVKYNRPGGNVRLTWRVVGPRCEIEVADTGRGIPEDQLASLFQPFNRLGAEDSHVQGTGIGLVLSKQLAETMGGSLHIVSRHGVGTTATLSLQCASRPLVDPRPERVDPTSGSLRTLRVLYAEDNEVNAELVRQLVSMRRGLSLRVAKNGSLALAMATDDPPDLMLVDMNLGDMTGIELARGLRRDRATREIPLIALSADALPEQIRTALDAGFEIYLTKPIQFEELLAVFDRYCIEVTT